MMNLGKAFVPAISACLLLASGSWSQDNTGAFTSESAILDTSIPFAIGAREARQELRGSFGWPTFQEGLVEGVYFRFDPDGYARFAPTPRLDSNVFEVICRAKTTACLGRKAEMSLILDAQGLLQIKIDAVLEGDKLFLVEGITEIPLPDQILMPLDTRFETLLSSGGDLVVRRGDEQVAQLSLSGFAAVSAYLRWVAARQDYTVLPPGWPVPNTQNIAPTLTQNAIWQSPMPQPQSLPIFDRSDVAAPKANSSEVAMVRSEISAIKDLLQENRSLAPAETPPAMNSSSQLATAPSVIEAPLAAQPQAQTTQGLLSELARLQNTLGEQSLLAEMGGSSPNSVMDPAKPAESQQGQLASRLEYLMTEIGLDAQTALMLLQGTESASTTETETVMQDDADVLIDEILAELHRQMNIPVKPETSVSSSEMAMSPSNKPSDKDYVLLSRYFRSVFGTAKDR